MAVTSKAIAECDSCKQNVEVVVKYYKGFGSGNGVIGPGGTTTVIHSAVAELPEGWIQGYGGTFCSEKCEDDWYEAKHGKGNRPNERRAEQRRQQQEKENEWLKKFEVGRKKK